MADSMVQSIGKYELKTELGKGASATVYLALDTFTGQDVALKVLAPEVVSGEEFAKTHMRQFMNEASLAGKLSHPHIAAILEAVISEGTGYIAIEYVTGGDLSQFTVPGRLMPTADAIEIAFKCCGALDYAYRQGIVPRDIKPANIMVVGGTNIKVSDFGAAYLQRAQATQIADIGSPLYMSPEQIRAAPLDYHSDMFALGVVLYELFTGQRPFAATTLPELFHRILDVDPVPPSKLRSGLAPAVDAILLRMMHKRAEERYPSWGELALELAGIGHLSVYKRAIPDCVKFTALRKIPFFERLDDGGIWELVHAGRWSRVPPKSTIVRESDAGQSLCFVGAGEVKVLKEGRLLNVLGPGEYFGEMAFVKEGVIPRQATVESITDVVLAEFEPSAIKNLTVNCHLELTTALLHALVDRLAMADTRMVRA